LFSTSIHSQYALETYLSSVEFYRDDAIRVSGFRAGDGEVVPQVDRTVYNHRCENRKSYK
jgi:hypothetical protein